MCKLLFSRSLTLCTIVVDIKYIYRLNMYSHIVYIFTVYTAFAGIRDVGHNMRNSIIIYYIYDNNTRSQGNVHGNRV